MDTLTALGIRRLRRCSALLALAATSCPGQTVVVTQTSTPAASLLPGTMNRMNIALDAAHGDTDNGARIADGLLEKDVTLSLALKLQALLVSHGFTVAMTRTTDSNASNDKTSSAASPVPLTLDNRAGILNRAQGSACLLLHATGSGNGVHLYSSELDGVSTEPAVLPWATAQAPWVAQSAQLERQLAAALRQAGVSRVAGRASVRPVDSLTCPALVVELGPENADVRSVADGDYQQRVAQTLAAALEAWSKQAQPPLRQPVDFAKPHAPKLTTPAASPAKGAQP